MYTKIIDAKVGLQNVTRMFPALEAKERYWEVKFVGMLCNCKINFETKEKKFLTGTKNV